jgi:hypothetical protein
MFTDGGTDNATPFIWITNTTSIIRANTFQGSGHVAQDAIILGGHGEPFATSIPTASGLFTGAFQGYGTVIEENTFCNLNRGVFGQAYSNSIVVANNGFIDNIGTRAIEFRATFGVNTVDLVYGVNINGNVIEMDVYRYGVVLAGVRNAVCAGNGFYDYIANTNYVADFFFATATEDGSSGISVFNHFEAGLQGATPFGQVGDLTQKTLQTVIGSQGGTDLTGFGVAASQFAKGANVCGSYSTATEFTGFGGALNVIDEFALTAAVSIGASSSTNRAYINGNQAAIAPMELVLNHGGGGVQAWGHFTTPQQVKSLSNGDNNDIGVTTSYARFTGPTGAFAVTGFTRYRTVLGFGGTPMDGQRLTIYNSTSQVMTIKHNTGSTAGSRILTYTGANVVLGANPSSAEFVYDSTDAAWILTSTLG